MSTRTAKNGTDTRNENEPAGARVALITGTSSGIGLETAVELARAGFRVIATMRNVAKREPLLAAARDAAVDVDVQPLDVTDAASIASCASYVGARYGRLDVLVNNAGYGLAGALEDVSAEQLRAQLETNLIGVVEVTKAFLPMMRRQRSGRIVNVSSAGGRMSFPLFGAYHASKFGLEGLTEAWHYELAPFGVSTSLVEPGAHRTEFDKGSLVRATPAASAYRDIVAAVEARQARFGHLMPAATQVSRTIRRAATASRPRLRYRVGLDAKAVLSLRSMLPSRVFRWTIARSLGVPRTIHAAAAAALLAALTLAGVTPAHATSTAPVRAEAVRSDELPPVPPPTELTADERARLVAGQVVTRSIVLSGSERRAEALFLFDAAPTELFGIVTEPAVMQRLFEENEVYEAVATYPDGLGVHGIANVGWPAPRFEYWTRTRRDPAKLWNAWRQTRGDFDANDGYWRFTRDEQTGKTIGHMSLHLSVPGLPNWLAVRLQETNLPKSMHIVAAEVARVRAQEPARAVALRSEWSAAENRSAATP
ncbi:MAG: SDR family oxidoreductase [bacterium]